MNAIYLYRIERWLYEKHIPILPKIIQALIFFIFNSKITPDTKIGKGSYFVCKGISTVLIPGTNIGDNCTLGLRLSTVRQFPYKDVPCLENNVWIGPNVIIAGPVIIGEDAIVVGGSFVTKSVPKGAIVSGNPAKIVGWRKDLLYDITNNPKYKEGMMPFLKERDLLVDHDETDNIGLIHKQVLKIIAKCLELDPNDLSGFEKMDDLDEWDSLSNVLVVTNLEKAFNIKIPNDDLWNLTSIPNYVKEVEICIESQQNVDHVNEKELLRSLNKIDAHKIQHSPLLGNVIKRAQESPSKIAIVNDGKKVSYALLIENIRKTASWLVNNGLVQGDKIILSGQKEIEFVYVYMASHLIGITNVIVDSKQSKDRLSYIEKVTDAKMCIGYQSDELPSKSLKDISFFNELPYIIRTLNLTPDDTSEILFTTGTTDKPKGVCLSYANVFASASNINAYIKNTKQDVEIIGLPICHSFGLGRVRCNLIIGSTLIFMNGFTNVFLFMDYIKRYNVTGFGVVPAAWAYLMKIGGKNLAQFANQIKYIEIGSAAMPLNTKLEMLNMFPNTRICMHYGSTEASRSCFMEFHDQRYLESIGKPVSNKVEIKICDSKGNEVPIGEKGEICIKGNMVMNGYLDLKHTQIAFFNDFFRTGDCGYQSTDGYFYLIGREKELINVGGKKVSPAEIEDTICSLGVGDCICVSTPDKDGFLGEVVKCYILKGSTKLSFEEIATLLQGKIETYKRPVVYEWIDKIPQTSSGKKQRVNLK